MSYLPIVERELRVASRKRSTFWLRISAALVALVIGAGFLTVSALGSFSAGPATLGRGMFGTLTWLSLATAFGVGLFFTSDCLSEEKREGTLGFLFLTDLRGYDVVLGKLLATSLRGCFALVAVFPILAVTLLMGGVTGAQFWRTALALVNALIFSLASGLFVSSMSRDSQRALGGTLFLLFLVLAGGPGVDEVLATFNFSGGGPIFRLCSPVYVFTTAGAGSPSSFWIGLLVSQVVAWLMLASACLLIPHTWQEKAAKKMKAQGNWAYRLKYGGARHREALRRKLLDLNPALWLACREGWQALTLWTVTVLLAGGFLVFSFIEHHEIAWMAWNYFGGLIGLFLFVGIASQAVRFLIEAKRSQLIELMLATPLTGKQIVQGQWHAMLRRFGLPLALYLAIQFIGGVLAEQARWKVMVGAMTPAVMSTGTNAVARGTNVSMTATVRIGPGVASTAATVTAGSATAPGPWVSLVSSAARTVTTLASFAALCWFGMWSGLTSKNANIATLKTFAFVLIIPSLVFGFLSAIGASLLLLPMLRTGGAGGPSWTMIWYPLAMMGLSSVLSLAKDFGFLLWSRRKLYSQFRERALRDVAPIRVALPPPTPKPSAPPVITAT